MSPPLPPKREVALALLERSSVHVHLDPRHKSVVVPPVFKSQAQLVLQIGLNMPVPIPDLRLDEDGMSCTLSFSRSPFHCVIPWASVFAMVGEDGRGMVWPDDLPPEVARQAAAAAKRTQAAARESATPADAADSAGAAGSGSKAPAAAGDKAREENGEETLAKKRTGKKRPRVVPSPALVPAPEEARARLVAVPAPPPSTPSAAGASSSSSSSEPRTPRVARQEEPSSPPARPRPSTPGAQRPSRPKRELPPYLRVVK